MEAASSEGYHIDECRGEDMKPLCSTPAATSVDDECAVISPGDCACIESSETAMGRLDVISRPLPVETSLWGTLPSDLLERVVSYLPFPYVYRVRSVCRRWDSLIHCNQFKKFSAESPISWGRYYSPRLGWKGATSSLVWSTYDLVDEKWIGMPSLSFPTAARNWAWNLIAAHGGLLCFGALEVRRILVSMTQRRILVCNPMTQRWKELPPLSWNSSTPVVTHMLVDELTNSYTIILAGNANYKESEDGYRSTEVYDSASNSWKVAGKLPPDFALKIGAYCKGWLYCVARNSTTGSYRVVLFNVHRRVWSETPLPLPEGFENYPYVVACGDRIYMVGGHLEGGILPLASVGIFELEPNTLKWIEIAQYQDRDFLQATGAIYGSGADGMRIYVVTYAYDMRVAVYDISSGVWERPIKGNFYDMKDIFETRFSFSPNIRISV